MSTRHVHNSNRQTVKGKHTGQSSYRLNLEHLEDRTLPTAANSAFVSALYTTLLNRSADAGGLAAWTAALDNGTLTPSQVANGFTSSPEFRADEINAAYELLLHVPLDGTTLPYWASFVGQGNSQSQVLAVIAGSDMYFQNRGGSTNDGFLQALWSDAYNRPIDAASQMYWDAKLAGGTSRLEVAMAVFTSPEYYIDQVASYYTKYLGRAPDLGGFTFWVNSLENGASTESVIAGFVGSQEFYQRSQTQPRRRPLRSRSM
jgi:hypothetical protein